MGSPRKLRYFVIVVGTFWPIAFAQAANTFLIGSELLKYCSASVGSPEREFCNAYILGVSDGLALSKDICMPIGTPPKQPIDTVISYLRAQPQKGLDSASSMVGAALMRTFPCH